jgi:hypothetical protein
MFSRRRDGQIDVRLPDEVRDVLVDVLRQYRELLIGEDDGALRRLFPTAYPDDDELEQEYRGLVHDTLLAGRLDALDTVDATLRADTLTEAQLAAWMGAINDLRLVIGTRLDVSEDDGPPDPDAPDAPLAYLYHDLGVLLEAIVTVMTEGLPPPRPDIDLA